MLDNANVIDTMNRPVIVHASDLEFYYCKYNRMDSRAYRLFKEFLIASFLPFWHFQTTPVNFIQVLDEHIPSDLGINRKHFDYRCFGLQLVENSTELDKHNIALLTKKRISATFREDFLRLCFFDIWTANEDRSHNNYNILLTGKEGYYNLLPIDHEACFNHGELSRALVSITYEESLIYSQAFAYIFKPVDFSTSGLVALKEKFYLCAQNCSKQIGDIFDSIPIEWGINIENEKNTLSRLLFNDVWFNEAWDSFISYIQFFINSAA